jgi:restriction system protein
LTGLILVSILVIKTFWGRIHLRSKLFGLSSNDLVDLTPNEFEEMVAELYRLMGHRARRTGSIGDHGVDVVVNAKNGEKWVVQCKRWRTQVGESIIRDFYGMMQHEKAAQGAIIATSGFSQPAKEWAKGKPVYLCNGNDFLRSMKKVKKQQVK